MRMDFVKFLSLAECAGAGELFMPTTPKELDKYSMGYVNRATEPFPNRLEKTIILGTVDISLMAMAILP